MFEIDFSEENLDPKLPKIGWLCTYIPEEVICAAGFHPVRLRANNPSTKLADTYLHYNLCPYVRSCLDLGLREEERQLKGIVIAHSCDAMRCLFHVWQHYVSSTSFIHFMNLPRQTSSLAVEYFKNEIQMLMNAFEDYTDHKIEESALTEAIGIYNETRDLMRELYELRKNAHSSLKGTRVFEIIEASQRMPKKIFNKRLKKFITAIKKQEIKASPTGPRIMIVGSLLPNSKLVQLIEDMGAVVVCDDLCFGSRYFEGSVEKGDDLLREISKRYLLKAPCARMKETELRFRRGERLVKEYKVEGIIYLTVKFCDNHLYDYPLYRKFFQKKGVPMLQIEEDYVGGNIGQIRTRVEAFIEML